MKANIPEVGAIVRPCGGEIRYRVVAASEYGCRVEAIDTEVTAVPGRKARPLHYSEKRAQLCATEFQGRPLLIDDRWRSWEIVP